VSFDVTLFDVSSKLASKMARMSQLSAPRHYENPLDS